MRKQLLFCGFYSWLVVVHSLGAEEPIADTPHTVIVVLEAKPGSETLLKEALIEVAKLSRLEASCLEYRFFQGKENSARLALYEQWKSKELYRQQFTKPYIINFVGLVEAWLGKSYDVIFGRKVSPYEPNGASRRIFTNPSMGSLP